MSLDKDVIIRIKNAIGGAIIGDAVGVPYEFKSRGTFEATDMVGHGTYDQPKGTWSDDSSMLLCIVKSLTQQGKCDIKDMTNKFKTWLIDGYMTPYGEVFDKGITTERSLLNPWMYDKSSEMSNGNGSLMRTLPIGIYSEYIRDLKDVSFKVSGITHDHIRAKLCCYFYNIIVAYMIESEDFKTAYENAIMCFIKIPLIPESEKEHFKRIISGEIIKEPIENIQSSGYVIHTLEATLWCMANSTSYEEAVLKAVNLGDDTDTTACVVGGLAGIEWGYKKEWYDQLASLDLVEGIIEDFIKHMDEVNEI